MKILIYGAGVIGCLYAALFAEAGIDTTVYARGKRLEQFQTHRMRYFKDGKICQANVKITGHIFPTDSYDFIFVTVREHQLHEALRELAQNQSPTIVTMVNSLEDYTDWEKICGIGRIVPAFPGAGGGFDETDVLDAALTPRLIQPTTFAEIDGQMTPRTEHLKTLFRSAKIPCQCVKDMHAWQLCHLAMVIPLADAYYNTPIPEKVTEDAAVMRNTAKQIKQNLKALQKRGVQLSPSKMRLFLLLPDALLQRALTVTYRSEFGNRFMYQHAMKAPDEMRELHRQFYNYLNNF